MGEAACAWAVEGEVREGSVREPAHGSRCGVVSAGCVARAYARVRSRARAGVWSCLAVCVCVCVREGYLWQYFQRRGRVLPAGRSQQRCRGMSEFNKR